MQMVVTFQPTPSTRAASRGARTQQAGDRKVDCGRWPTSLHQPRFHLDLYRLDIYFSHCRANLDWYKIASETGLTRDSNKLETGKHLTSSYLDCAGFDVSASQTLESAAHRGCTSVQIAFNRPIPVSGSRAESISQKLESFSKHGAKRDLTSANDADEESTLFAIGFEIARLAI